MRILLACLQSVQLHPVAAYSFWETYFKRGIEEAGHEWVEVPEVDWVEALVLQDEQLLVRWRERTWTRTLEFVRKASQTNPIHFFLGYFYPQMIDPGAIQEIRGLGIPCVNFFCDNVREFRRVPREFKGFDLHWVPEFEALPMYRKARQPYMHAPMPCWVPPELRTVPLIETEPPTFIGSADLLRRDLFGRAMLAGADFVVRGAGWNSGMGMSTQNLTAKGGWPKAVANQFSFWRNHGIVSLGKKWTNRLLPLSPPIISVANVQPAPTSSAEYQRLTRGASITLGVNRVSTRRRLDRNPLTYSRLRDVEAPMLGACYLTEWTAGLGELYELGREIETYRTAEELPEKIKELRTDRARRLLLRRAGQTRALNDHAIGRTLRKINSALGVG